MITRREHQLVELTLRISCGLILFPHNLGRNSPGKVSRLIPSSRRKEILVKVNCLVSLSYAVFLVMRLHPVLGYAKEELEQLTFETLLHYFWTFVHLTCFVVQLFAVRHKYEFASLYNQVLLFNLDGGNDSVFIDSEM